jgi:hypothetical protein
MDAFVALDHITTVCLVAHHGDTVLFAKNHRQTSPKWELPKQNRPTLKAGFRTAARTRLKHMSGIEIPRERFLKLIPKLVPKVIVGKRAFAFFKLELTDQEIAALPRYDTESQFELKMFNVRDLGPLTDLSGLDRQLIRKLE